MIHEMVKPSTNLEKVFSVFHLIRSESPDEVVYPFKAGPKTALAFCYSGLYRQIHRGKITCFADISVIGPVLTPYTVVFNAGPFELILAEFTETGYYSAFRQDAHQLVNGHQDLRLVADDEIFREAANLNNGFKIGMRAAEKIPLLEKFLRRLVTKEPPAGVETIEAAAEMIKQSVSDLDILSLAKDLGINSRTLQRRFKSIVGLTPKQYAEMVRFTKLFDFLMSGKKVNLLKKLHALGYYDQAHAIRAFNKYAGFSPRNVIHEQFRLAACLSGPFAGAVREPD